MRKIRAPPRLRRQPPRLVERRGPADVVGQQVVELGEERLVLTDAVILVARAPRPAPRASRHEPAAERAVGIRARRGRDGRTRAVRGDVQAHLWLHTRKRVEQRAQLRILMPGDDSTPDDTSMPAGRTRATARQRHLPVRQAARQNRRRRARAMAAARSQSMTRPVPPRFARSCASSSSMVPGHSLTRSSMSPVSAIALMTRRESERARSASRRRAAARPAGSSFIRCGFYLVAPGVDEHAYSGHRRGQRVHNRPAPEAARSRAGSTARR